MIFSFFNFTSYFTAGEKRRILGANTGDRKKIPDKKSLFYDYRLILHRIRAVWPWNFCGRGQQDFYAVKYAIVHFSIVPRRTESVYHTFLYKAGQERRDFLADIFQRPFFLGIAGLDFHSEDSQHISFPFPFMDQLYAGADGAMAAGRP